jgi:hypothetical protein
MQLEPTRLVTLRTPWPPNDSLTSRTITLADNWWTLAIAYQRPDVWDIIYDILAALFRPLESLTFFHIPHYSI